LIKGAVEREKALGESPEFAASAGILYFQTEQLEEMTNSGQGVANDWEIHALRHGGLREREFGNGMERRSALTGAVKFALQILLRDVEIPEGHADIFVSQQLHESGQTDTEAQHGGCESVPQAVRSNRGSAAGGAISVG